jgi:hypothetical protein
MPFKDLNADDSLKYKNSCSRVKSKFLIYIESVGSLQTLEHLACCTPSKCGLYFADSPAVVSTRYAGTAVTVLCSGYGESRWTAIKNDAIKTHTKVSRIQAQDLLLTKSRF